MDATLEGAPRHGICHLYRTLRMAFYDSVARLFQASTEWRQSIRPPASEQYRRVVGSLVRWRTKAAIWSATVMLSTAVRISSSGAYAASLRTCISKSMVLGSRPYSAQKL